MAVHFPEKPEIRLADPPLAEVICQVRFPPILRIVNEEPSKFQDCIRHRFPGFEIEQAFMLRIPGLSTVGEPSAEIPPRVFRFKSFDEASTASLAVDFYALSTNRYSHWSDFVDDLMVLHEAVEKTYQPAYAMRIGLRYVNRFDRAKTGLDTMQNVLSLIRSELTSMLTSDAWSDPQEWISQLVLADGDGRLTLRFALNSENDEPFLLLDFDYFEQGNIPLNELRERVNRYHSIIYRAFRWCLHDESLDVFSPQIAEATEYGN